MLSDWSEIMSVAHKDAKQEAHVEESRVATRKLNDMPPEILVTTASQDLEQ